MHRLRRTDRTDATRTAAALALAALVALAAPARAQYYAKVDLVEASAKTLHDPLRGDSESSGPVISGLTSLSDARMAGLFRALAGSADTGEQACGVLGDALLSKKGIDPTLMAGVRNSDTRGRIVREANVAGLLRATPVDAILAQGNLPDPATLTLVSECERRGTPWDAKLLTPMLAGKDQVAEGLASLLLKAHGDPAPWDAYRTRLAAMPEAERSSLVRFLSEGVLVFELRALVPVLLAERASGPLSDEAAFALVGTALRLSTKEGVEAWQDWVASHRSQAALQRAAMQLLASVDLDIPAGAFDQVRNGTRGLDAIADAGKALRSGADPAQTLVTLLDVGHLASSEWALLRATTLPPEQAAKVWHHLDGTIRTTDPDAKPSGFLIASTARELMRTDPSALKSLVEWANGKNEILVPILAGIYDSGRPETVPIARGLRGKLPRTGEVLAVLALARCGAPLSDDDIDVLGRAAAGSGDVTPVQQAQAAWYYLIAKLGSPDAACARVTGTGNGGSK